MVINIDGGVLMRYAYHDHQNQLPHICQRPVWGFDVVSSYHTLLPGSETANLIEYGRRVDLEMCGQ